MPLVPPGLPGATYLVSSSESSLVLATKLSNIGYLSVTFITFVLTDPNDAIINHKAMIDLQPGEVATVAIQELQPATTYSVYAYATNSAGNSENNTASGFTTCKTCLL